MPKLGVSEHEIVKIRKKGDFGNFLDQFWDLILKRVPKIFDPRILWKPFGTNGELLIAKEFYFEKIEDTSLAGKKTHFRKK